MYFTKPWRSLSIKLDWYEINKHTWENLVSYSKQIITAYESKYSRCGLDQQTVDLCTILLKQNPKIFWKNDVHPTWKNIVTKSNWYGLLIAEEICKIIHEKWRIIQWTAAK